MFSRGSINGEMMDAFSIDGGNFVEEMDAASALRVTDSAVLTARRGMSSAGNARMASTSTLLRRVSMGSAVLAKLLGAATVTRRPQLSGSTRATLKSTATAVRRITHVASPKIAFSTAVTLSWAVLRSIPRARTVLVTEMRSVRVPAERRRIVVNPDPRSAIALRDRGRA